MKENVIIGKLIPAGTGMKRYRNIQIDSEVAVEEQPLSEEVVNDDFDEESVIATVE
jgi:DNA-directed RNA polymerase subunit beta'